MPRAVCGGMETQSPYPYGIEGEGSPLAPRKQVPDPYTASHVWLGSWDQTDRARNESDG